MFEHTLEKYRLKRELEDIALENGYHPFEPELFEDYEQFNCLKGTITKEELVTVVNGQRQFLLLRPDITAVLMRQVMPLVQEEETLKLFYQSTIYRSLTEDASGLNQFGIECLGKVDKTIEQEVVRLAIAYLGRKSFLLEVGNTKFLQGLLASCKLDEKQEKILKKLIYIKSKDEVNSFSRKNGFPPEVIQVLEQIFTFRGRLETIYKKVQPYILNETMEEAVAQLMYFQQWEDQITFDLSMVNKLLYYEGTIFKGYYRNVPKEVLSGGRYDKLSEKYDKKINAIGFSIDIDEM